MKKDLFELSKKGLLYCRDGAGVRRCELSAVDGDGWYSVKKYNRFKRRWSRPRRCHGDNLFALVCVKELVDE